MDYYALMGLPCGCDQSKLERPYCFLDLRYKLETTICFITRCKLADEQDVQPVKHRARMSIDLFYKLHQKGYSSVHVGANGGWFCSYNKLLQMQMHMYIQLLNARNKYWYACKTIFRHLHLNVSCNSRTECTRHLHLQKFIVTTKPSSSVSCRFLLPYL